MINLKDYESGKNKNILNQIRKNNMTLQELRLFSIYLSRINANDVSTQKVRFTLENFCKIMDIQTDVKQITGNMHHLLQKFVDIPYEDGKKGFLSIPLFKECGLFKDHETRQYFFEIEAHEKALPYMFDFKEQYFTYNLWNVFQLKSSNQLRMYEILKQHEKIENFQISLIELRTLLNINSEEYPRWDRFKERVLDSCQQALAEHTDITFIYNPVRTGHRFTDIIFYIKKNPNYVDYLKLNDFISQESAKATPEEPEKWVPLNPNTDDAAAEKIYKDENLTFLAGACNYEFSPKEVEVLFNYLLQLGYAGYENAIKRYKILRQAYNIMNADFDISEKDTITDDNIHDRRFEFMEYFFESQI